MSCKEPIKHDVLKEAKFYIYVCYGIAIAAFTSLVIIFGVLLKPCISKCKSKDDKNKGNQQRSGNRMVVNANDFDEIHQNTESKRSDIEMADRARKQKKQAESKKAVNDFKKELGEVAKQKIIEV